MSETSLHDRGPPYADEDLIPISALQHHLFCPRQCALIHVDGLWAENQLTAHGKVLHERSDSPGKTTRRSASSFSETDRDHEGSPRVRIERAVPLVSRTLGLVGKADQVAFPIDESGVLTGPPRPIEHKRGSPKRLDHDRVQLAAQAMCLEEMLGVTIDEGDLFYNQTRRRERVVIDGRLRQLVRATIAEVRRNIALNITPPAKKQAKCRSCSLLNLCLPSGTGPSRDPMLYLKRSMQISLAACAEDDPA